MNRAKINFWLPYALAGASIIYFGWQMRNFVRRHAVNVLFFDQWDFLTPLFENPTAWEMFTRQHGPHRQGLGLFVSRAVGEASAWDTRAESAAIALILILATFAALYLKRRLFSNLTVWDTVIPAIVLSYTQLEAVVLTPNPAHGAIPLVLVLAASLLLTLDNIRLRYFGLIPVTFAATYTGFGFFLGLLIPAVLLLCALLHWARKEKQALIVSAFAFTVSAALFGSFFLNYTFSSVRDCFVLPHQNPAEFFSFLSLELSSFFGFFSLNHQPVATTVGFVSFVTLIAAAGAQVWHLWRTRAFESRHLVIILLIGFSILFAFNSTAGRVCGGLAGAQSSRYMTLLIPAWLGLYFALQGWLQRSAIQALVNSLLLVMFIVVPIHGFRDFNKGMYAFAEVKKAWAACYIEREDIEACDKAAGNVIYPAPEATGMKEKLKLLKEKRYNLFASK